MRIRNRTGISLAVQWLRMHTSMHGAWVRSLVRELRSYKSHGMAKRKKKKIKNQAIHSWWYLPAPSPVPDK